MCATVAGYRTVRLYGGMLDLMSSSTVTIRPIACLILDITSRKSPPSPRGDAAAGLLTVNATASAMAAPILRTFRIRPPFDPAARPAIWEGALSWMCHERATF